MSDTLRVLTVRQPRAGAIVHLGCDVLNMPQRWAYRGPVLIHAGLYKPGDADWMEADEYSGVEPKDWRTLPMNYGQIIGITEIVDCVDCTATERALDADGNELGVKQWMIGGVKWWDASPWYDEERFGYVLRHTQPLTPTPYKGGQGLRKYVANPFHTIHDELDAWAEMHGYAFPGVDDKDHVEWERSAE